MNEPSHKGLHIIRWDNQPDDFLKAITRCEIAADHFTLNLQYRMAFAENDLHDRSFCIVKNDNVHLIVLCHQDEDVLNFNSGAIHFLGQNDNKKIVRAAFDELERLACANDIKDVRIADYGSGDTLSVLGAQAFQRDGVPTCRLESAIDLLQSEDDIKRNLRGSYKSLINQTRRDMKFVVMSQDNPDRELFNEFKTFHLKVAGRQTRSNKSWDKQFDMITAGCAELILGYIEPHGLVSSALFTDLGRTTSYAVAVYDRELFGQRSLAHANVYEGILGAKNRGQTRFVLGNIPPRGTASDKEHSIGVFKKGFCDQPQTYLEWAIPLTNVQIDTDN